AQAHNRGASSTMPQIAMVEPTKDAHADSDSATLANPCRAKGEPSNVVMTAAASPGTLIRMEVIRPPYSAPTYTAANRIRADSGGSFMAKAIGTSMATPLIGPSPGNTPTMVPIKAPIAAT